MNETTGVSPFFANYSYHHRLGVEPPHPKPPNLSESLKKEYLRADSIANCFDCILTKLQALTRHSQERYEDNTNSRRSEAPIYTPGDEVMISLKNLKTNRPKKSGMTNGMVLTKYSRCIMVQLLLSFRNIFKSIIVSIPC